VLYAANRSYQPGNADTRKIISNEGENSIVVYEIDPQCGTLTEIQRIPSGGVCPRTLTIDPTGALLVAANSETYWVGDDEHAVLTPKNLAAFSVLADGRLALKRTYSVPIGSDRSIIGWTGIGAPESTSSSSNPKG
jgi:hypothetical protein